MERLDLAEFNAMAAHPSIIEYIRHRIRKLAGEEGTVLVLTHNCRLTEEQISAVSKDWDPARFRFPYRYS